MLILYWNSLLDFGINLQFKSGGYVTRELETMAIPACKTYDQRVDLCKSFWFNCWFNCLNFIYK